MDNDLPNSEQDPKNPYVSPKTENVAPVVRHPAIQFIRIVLAVLFTAAGSASAFAGTCMTLSYAGLFANAILSGNDGNYLYLFVWVSIVSIFSLAVAIYAGIRIWPKKI